MFQGGGGGLLNPFTSQAAGWFPTGPALGSVAWGKEPLYHAGSGPKPQLRLTPRAPGQATPEFNVKYQSRPLKRLLSPLRKASCAGQLLKILPAFTQIWLILAIFLSSRKSFFLKALVLLIIRYCFTWYFTHIGTLKIDFKRV